MEFKELMKQFTEKEEVIQAQKSEDAAASKLASVGDFMRV